MVARNRKWNGKAHWVVPGRYLGEDLHGWWIFQGAKGVLISRPGAAFYTASDAVLLVPRTGGYVATFYDDTYPGDFRVYVDLAAAHDWNTIRPGVTEFHMIDMDLDVIRSITRMGCIVDDEDEFERAPGSHGLPGRTSWNACARRPNSFIRPSRHSTHRSTAQRRMVQERTGMSGIIRVYKRDDEGVLHFREAWFDEDYSQFVMNHGVVGHQSKTDETDVADAAAVEGLMDAFAVQCEEDGYAEIPEEEQFWVVAQYALKTKDGTERDRYLEEKAKDALISQLAWRGLGTVERSEFGDAKLNIFCLCPDVNKAVNAIKVCIRGEDLDFTKLSIGAAPFSEPEAFRLKHSPKPGAGFTL